VRSARAKLLDDPQGHDYRFTIPQDHAAAAAVHVHVSVDERNW
jgi:hypothetical protein